MHAHIHAQMYVYVHTLIHTHIRMHTQTHSYVYGIVRICACLTNIGWIKCISKIYNEIFSDSTQFFGKFLCHYRALEQSSL